MFPSNDGKSQIQLENNSLTVAPIDSISYFSHENFLGTFQIIHHTKDREIFSHDIFLRVEARRSETEVVLWKISDLTTIRIFPRNLIMPPMNYRIQEQEIIETEK